jgi:hypothetical protein
MVPKERDNSQATNSNEIKQEEMQAFKRMIKNAK